jgi:hypothetical protein
MEESPVSPTFIAFLVLTGPAFLAEEKPYAEIDQHALNATPADEASLAKLARYLVEPCKTDQEKARAIYRWVTDRIAYDTESFFAGRPGDGRPEAVLKSRKGVCEGYANLYGNLAERAGLKVVKIAGLVRPMDSAPGQKLSGLQAHAWNAVRFDDRWWLLDSTWGAGGLNGKNYTKQFSEFFFLTPPEMLIYSHLPFDPRWQLLEATRTRTQFERQPKIPRGLLNLGLSADMVQSTISDKSFREFARAFTYPGSATALVRGPLNRHLKAEEEYEFEFRSSDFVVLAAFHEGKVYPFQKKGKDFMSNIKLGKGTLRIGGKLKEEDNRYATLLEYVIE